MELKHLDTHFEIRALNEDGTFSGYGSVFDEVDSYNERVAKGAFRRSLRQWKKKGGFPKLLWQHNSREPIGIYTKMREDDTGLYLEGKLALNDNVPEADKAYSLMKLGAVDGLSIGFMTQKSEYDEKKGIRTLLDVDLFEVSVVTFPANQAATVTAVKAEDITPRYVEGILREAGISRSIAKGISLKGVPGLKELNQREAGEGLNELLANLRDANASFNPSQ